MNDVLKDGTNDVSRQHVGGRWVVNIVRNTDDYVRTGGPAFGVYLWNYKDLQVTLVGSANTEEEARALAEDQQRIIAITLLRDALGLENDDDDHP